MLEEDGRRVVLQREGLASDLIEQGWKLTERAPARLFAVSERWGGTLICATIAAVERSARTMMSYVTWIEDKQKELQEASQ